ncbi:MAG: OsmC family protein [Deltaproteobacteria bacterium]|nr:OsmC family protein [Deltaproteobacteria bacterium]
MPTELTVHAVHQGGMRVCAGTDGHTVQMDYPLKPGEELAGLTPLQMLLASLAGCSANTLMAVLVRRMQQPVRGMEVHAHGLRRDEHPMVLTEITLDFMVRGRGPRPRCGGTRSRGGQ